MGLKKGLMRLSSGWVGGWDIIGHWVHWVVRCTALVLFYHAFYSQPHTITITLTTTYLSIYSNAGARGLPQEAAGGPRVQW